MVAQLPPEALGVAVWVLAYSVLCLACSSLMIWMVWLHRERDSYVALLSYFSFLSTLASIAQQLHSIFEWRAIKVAQFRHITEHLGSPEIAIAGPSVGLDLVLFYIQFYCYNVEAILTLFWAATLTHCVFRFAEFRNLKHGGRKLSIAAKVLAVFIPIPFLSLLRLQVVRHSSASFLILANITILVSLTIGSLLLLVILARYIYTRRYLLEWSVQYPHARTSEEADRGATPRSSAPSRRLRKTIYDKWLVVRFAVAFVLLGAFQIITILSEISQLRKHSAHTEGKAPDLSPATARYDFLQYMPGVSVSLLVSGPAGTD
ncbi:hypothetical protein F4780DRAFT_419965 [Xylariomycetidae sp. FL0641]|nr:hypothetical protein F4780DRAFT_419965 [Xylariomycetidae sp. FL0641]